VARRRRVGLHNGQFRPSRKPWTGAEEGWTYQLTTPRRGNVERVEAMRLSEEQLSLAWLTANRRVDNDTDLFA
jgi:hypothetical protein